MSTDINDTLTERGNRYGPFRSNAEIAQAFKALIRTYPGFLNLSPPHAEALDMVMVKISRILTGDPNYADNWHDIAGFATLAERECAVPGKLAQPVPGKLAQPVPEKPLGPGDVLHMQRQALSWNTNNPGRGNFW